MKRYGIFLIIIGMLWGVFPASAQESATDNVIVIDDANPVVELLIEPVPDTSGVVALEVYHAAVTVVDDLGNLLFLTIDPRIETIELQSAPGARPYTINVQQLSPSAPSYLRITGQSNLTTPTDPTLMQLVSQSSVGMAQETDMHISAEQPVENLIVNLPAEEGGLVSVDFPGADLGVQLLDATGMSVATLTGTGFDGLSLGLTGGNYQLSVFDPEPVEGTETFASARVIPLESNDLVEFASTQATTITTASSSPACSITIGVSSVNLRSGPGTGYSVLGFGFRDESLAVGGMNPGGSWYVVGYDGGSAWVGAGLGTTQGNCDSLAVYDIPYRDAPAAPVVVQEAEPVVVQVQVPYSGPAPSSSSAPAPSSSSSHESSGHYEDDDGGNESSGS